MEYAIKKVSESEREISITIKKDYINKLTEEKIGNLRGSINISGFRKGKVPLNLIKKKYGDSIQDEILSKFLDKNIKEIIIKEKLKPISTPTIKKKSDENVDIFLINFEIFPIIQVKHTSFDLEKPTVEISEKDIDGIIDNIKNEFGNWIKVDRKSEIGDKIKIQYKIFKNQEEKSVLKTQEKEIELKNKNIVEFAEKSFDISLLKYSVNEIKQVKINENKSSEEYTIDLKILHISKKEKLSSYKDIAKIIKCPSDNIKEIRKQIKENTDKQIDEISNNYLKNEVLRKLYEKNKFNIPNSILQNQDQSLENDYDKTSLKQKITIELLIKEIIKKESLTIKKVEIQNKLEELYKINPELKSDKIKDNLIKNVKNELLIDNVNSFILKRSKIKKITETLENFLSKYKI